MLMSLLGFAIVAVTGWIWFQRIQQVKVPRNRKPFFAGFISGGLIGLVGAFQGGWFAIVLGGAAAVVGLGFSALRLVSGQRPNTPAAGIGDAMLVFAAPDETGASFDLTSLAGKPYLLKFFRGHW